MCDDFIRIHDKAKQAYRLLAIAYGAPAWQSRLDPVSELVTTILSQNTSDLNQHRAFRSLRQRYPAWEDVLAAPLDELAEVIRPAGLARQRAPRIRAVLEHILREQGQFCLDFLKELSIEDAKEWLTDINGIGPKTAAIVLLFSLGIPAFPVDTHVHRVTRRLGLVPEKSTAEKAQMIMEELVPESWYYPLHMNLITHGRQICKAQRPLCQDCVLSGWCDHWKKQVQGEDAGAACDVPQQHDTMGSDRPEQMSYHGKATNR